VAALITIDPEALPAWLERTGRPASTPMAGLVDDPALRAEIQTAIDAANRAVSRAESIRAFAILPEDWTETGGQLTPSMKVRRNVVATRYADRIDGLYLRWPSR
jgi:long-chain acyl-CoA synthetase